MYKHITPLPADLARPTRNMPQHRAGDHPYDQAMRRFKIKKLKGLKPTARVIDTPWMLRDRRAGKTWYISDWQGCIELAQALTR